MPAIQYFVNSAYVPALTSGQEIYMSNIYLYIYIYIGKAKPNGGGGGMYAQPLSVKTSWELSSLGQLVNLTKISYTNMSYLTCPSLLCWRGSSLLCFLGCPGPPNSQVSTILGSAVSGRERVTFWFWQLLKLNETWPLVLMPHPFR